MQLKLLKGYPDLVGRRKLFCGYGNGPASYSQTTGDPVSATAYENYIDIIFGGVQSPDGTYYYQARPSGYGARQTWSLFYFVTATGAQVANGTNLAGETFQVAGFGGEY